MKKTQRSKPAKRGDELRAEYEFDYRKARPNRFAGRTGETAQDAAAKKGAGPSDFGGSLRARRGGAGDDLFVRFARERAVRFARGRH